MGRTAGFLLVLCVIGSCCGTAWAGNNAGALATLSWSRNVQLTDLTQVPSTPFPLFLQLDGAPDVRSLAVTLRWTPADSTAACYRLVPNPPAADSCGSSRAEAPGGNFGGDSTYTWRIDFPPGPSRSCVRYLVAGAECTNVPASFCLASVMAMDSLGAIDSLRLGSGATILGGVSGACPASLAAVFPTSLSPGVPATVTLSGTNFDSGMSASLHSGTSDVQADSVEVDAPDAARAHFTLPLTVAGTLDAQIHVPSGATATLNSALMAESSNNAIITGVHVGGEGDAWYWHAADGYSARIGRWSAPPCCYGCLRLASAATDGDCENGCPGPAPGTTTFTVDIDVRDGGYVGFSYNFQTYAGGYSWLDIYLTTPTGTVPLLMDFRSPNCQLPYWESGPVSFGTSLTRFQNEQVQLVISVTDVDDTWNQQARAVIDHLAIRPCTVAPLTPLDEADAPYENGLIDTQNLAEPLRTALTNFSNAVTAAGGTITVTSGYRPPSYQSHLLEVFTRWRALKDHHEPECSDLKAQVQAELDHHWNRPPPAVAGPTSRHCKGEAFDATVTGISDVDGLAEQYHLYRPYNDSMKLVFEPWHFQYH